MAKTLDWDIITYKFEIQSRYYTHFLTNGLGKDMNFLSALSWTITLLFFYKNGFVIKLLTKVDMPSNKETKPNKYMVSSNYFYLTIIIIIIIIKILINRKASEGYVVIVTKPLMT